MTFFTWMIRKHQRDDTPIGDLARDMQHESKKFVRSTAYCHNRNYLELHGACDDCMEAFEDAWKEYAGDKAECDYA